MAIVEAGRAKKFSVEEERGLLQEGLHGGCELRHLPVTSPRHLLALPRDRQMTFDECI